MKLSPAAFFLSMHAASTGIGMVHADFNGMRHLRRSGRSNDSGAKPTAHRNDDDRRGERNLQSCSSLDSKACKNSDGLCEWNKKTDECLGDAPPTLSPTRAPTTASPTTSPVGPMGRCSDDRSRTCFAPGDCACSREVAGESKNLFGRRDLQACEW